MRSNSGDSCREAALQHRGRPGRVPQRAQVAGLTRFDGLAVIDEFTALMWITLEPSTPQYPL
jgi:hypothetical protein